ncbi:hypothetical protein [Acidimangrovimonas pyrenivorans]|uniref:Uncharacterized protein n=1 Tax=Acidimangrovimonas pyrenivorans TaxID=2030798 RepID=A0ABV7AE55_9RHOB
MTNRFDTLQLFYRDARQAIADRRERRLQLWLDHPGHPVLDHLQEEIDRLEIHAADLIDQMRALASEAV